MGYLKSLGSKTTDLEQIFSRPFWQLKNTKHITELNTAIIVMWTLKTGVQIYKSMKYIIVTCDSHSTISVLHLLYSPVDIMLH